MADNKLDSILLEIGATTDKADGGIDKVTKALSSMKKITEEIDKDKFEQILRSMQKFSNLGNDLKNAGNGMRGIASSIKSMTGVDTSKLKEIAAAMKEVGSALGNLGSNNRVSIKVDSAGIQKLMSGLSDEENKVSASGQAVGTAMEQTQTVARETATEMSRLADEEDKVSASGQTMESAMQQIQESVQETASEVSKLSNEEDKVGASGQTAANGQRAFNSSLRQINISGTNEKIQALINQIKQYKTTISNMESGKANFDTSGYEKAVTGLRYAEKEFEQFKKSIQEYPKTMEDVANSIQQIGNAAQNCGLSSFSSVLSHVAAILPNIETGGMAASAGFQSMATGLSAVQAAIPIIGLILTILTAVINAAKKAATAISNAFGKVASCIKSVVLKVRQGVASIIAKFKEFNKKLKETLGISDKSLSAFSKKLKSLIRLGTFMLLRKVFTYLFKYIGDGFNNLVLYSDAFGTKFHSSVSRLWSDIKWVGNSLATVFEPIIDYIIPALDMLISKLVSATGALAQFFSALAGKNTYTKAIKLNDDYAESLKKASKAANNLTTGIDELNILQENKSTDAGETAPEESFVTEDILTPIKDFAQKVKEAWNIGDFTDIGKGIGDKLAKSLADIPWDDIREKARNIGKSLATLINGFIQGEFDGKSVSWWIGHTLGEALNTAFEFLYGFVHDFDFAGFGTAICDLIIGALDSIDWDLIKKTIVELAEGIRDFLNTIFGNTEMWEKLGTAISTGINTVLQGIWILVDGFDAGAFGRSMGKFFTNAVAMIDFPLIGKTLSRGIMQAFESIYNFAVTFDFDTLAKNLAGGINNFFNGLHWKDYIVIGEDGQSEFKVGITNSFVTLCGKLGGWLAEIIKETDFGAAGEALGNAIMTLFAGIKNFFDQIDPTELGNKIADFVNNAVDAFSVTDVLKSVNTVIHWFKTLFDTAISEIKWQEIFDKMRELIAGVDWWGIFSTTFKVIAKIWQFKYIFEFRVIWEIGKQLIAGILQGILDALSNIGNWIKEHLVDPIVNAVKSLFGIHSPSTVFAEIGQMLIAGLLEGLMATWESITSFFTQAWEALKTTISTALSAVNEVARAGWELIKTTFTEAWEGIISGVTEAWSTISTTFTEAWENVKAKTSEAWTSIKENFSQSWENIKSGVSQSWDAIKTSFSESWESIKSKTQEAWEHIVNIFTSSWDRVKTSIREAWDSIKETFSRSLEEIRNGVSAAWEAIKSAFSDSWDAIKASVSNGWDHVKETFKNSWENIKNTTEKAWQTIKESFNTSWEAMKASVKNGMESIKGHFTEAFNAIKNVVSESWNNIKSKFESGMKNASSAIQSGWSNIKSAFSSGVEIFKSAVANVPDWLEYGKNIVSGIWNGISSGWDWLKNSVGNLASSLLDAAKGVLGIHSPSRKFAEIGRYMVQGLNVGLEDNVKSSLDTVRSWADSLADIPMTLSTQLKVNDSTLSDYQNNYGSDFTNEAIVQRVTREVSTNGAVQATLNSGGGLKEAIKEAISEEIRPQMEKMVEGVWKQADKKEKTIVQIGNRAVNDAVTTQRNANGYEFAT